MNLRTITFYAVYNPKRKEIAFGRQFKKDLNRCHIPHGHVIVKMKGNYIRRADGSDKEKDHG